MKFCQWCDGMAQRAFNLHLISDFRSYDVSLPHPSTIPLIDMADVPIDPDLLAQTASVQSTHQNKRKAAELADEISAMPKRGKPNATIIPPKYTH